MPPRKKAAPADTDPNVTQDPPTTRTVRSSARIASQAIPVAASSDTADGATSSKPASKARNKAPPKPKPASKTTKPASKVRSKRAKADADDDEDVAPASKKPKISVVDEEEEEDGMDVDTKDDKKMVTPTMCWWFVPADPCIKVTVLQRGAAPVDPHSGMVGQYSTASI